MRSAWESAVGRQSYFVLSRAMDVKVLTAITVVLGAVAGLSGCGVPEASFSKNAQSNTLAPELAQGVDLVLVDHFGTPNALVGWEKFSLDYGKGNTEASQPEQREAGWKLREGRNLYMVHCVHCHGTAGDGNGPTAKFLNPLPRDFRQGVFKFTSTRGPNKPSRSDLMLTVQQGIPGTAMPSFVLVGDEQVKILVEYVMWLASRGESEKKLIEEVIGVEGLKKVVDLEAKSTPRLKVLNRVIDELEPVKGLDEDPVAKSRKALAPVLDRSAEQIANEWKAADVEDNVVLPKVKRVEPTTESLDRGRKLYLSDRTKCADCHGLTGRGDGKGTEDFWEIPKSSPKQMFDRPGLHDNWGFPVKPRDLTKGLYRGGRRPLDLYRRVHAGIKGTPMPGFGTALKDEEIWDIVNFVLSLPFDGKVSAQASVETPPKEGKKAGDHVTAVKP